MTQTATAAPKFTDLGHTDECTECQHCGRVDLKHTVLLGELDADGTVIGTTYFGVICAARATGRTTKSIRRGAELADQDRARAAAQAERERTWALVQARADATRAAR